MTTFRKRLPFPDLFARGRREASRAGTEWESVMVQITLAFVIILGYLISKGIIESQNLAAETARLRKDYANLNQVVAEFAESEVGQERMQRIAAQRELQLQRLLNRWLSIRSERLFRRLVQQYRHAELIQLSDDLRSLPIESSYHDLNAEIDRIFLNGTEKVSPQELQTLINSVLTAEGFDLSAVVELLELERISPEGALLHDDPSAPTLQNLTMLKLQIAGDLDAERKELVQIQYALVEKIADARRKKLLTRPLEAGGGAAVDGSIPDLGRVILERILNELREEMRLLPETVDRIRGTIDTTPAVEQN